MFEQVIRFLHQKDQSVLLSLAYSENKNMDLAAYVSRTADSLRSALNIDEGIYCEKNTNTVLKLSILRRLFALYGVEPMELVFYLKDQNSEKAAESSRYELRRQYRTYALPIIQKQHIHRDFYNDFLHA